MQTLEGESRAVICARLSQEYYERIRAEEIMAKCAEVAKERGHRSLILSEKDSTSLIIGILKENGFVLKSKNDATGTTTYINW
jgi:hypothetical protein